MYMYMYMNRCRINGGLWINGLMDRWEVSGLIYYEMWLSILWMLSCLSRLDKYKYNYGLID